MTYRNSCLAVLVGDVGKSSSLQMKIQESRKQKGSTSTGIHPLVTTGPRNWKAFLISHF